MQSDIIYVMTYQWHLCMKCYLIIVHQLLLHHLHGVDAVCLFETHQQHLGVAAPADHSEQVEVYKPQTGHSLP